MFFIWVFGCVLFCFVSDKMHNSSFDNPNGNISLPSTEGAKLGSCHSGWQDFIAVLFEDKNWFSFLFCLSWIWTVQGLSIIALSTLKWLLTLVWFYFVFTVNNKLTVCTKPDMHFNRKCFLECSSIKLTLICLSWRYVNKDFLPLPNFNQSFCINTSPKPVKV